MKTKLKVGDVVLIKKGGYGFGDEDVGKYVEVVGSDEYCDEEGVRIIPYDTQLETETPGINNVVGLGSFGICPIVKLNVFEDSELKSNAGEDVVDMVQSPKHYRLFHKDDIEGDFIEVKHVVKAILDRWEEQQEISMSFNQAGCYKEMLQYLLRAPAKNNIQDVEKAGYYLKEILDEW